MEEKKLTDERYWIIGGFVLVIIVFFYFIADDNQKYDEICIDNCIYSAERCLSEDKVYSENSLTWYIKEGDIDICFLDLEICIDDCKE